MTHIREEIAAGLTLGESEHQLIVRVKAHSDTETEEMLGIRLAQHAKNVSSPAVSAYLKEVEKGYD